MINGSATYQGTRRYLKQFPFQARVTPRFLVSPIALGTHLGDMTMDDSVLYRESILYALTNGINFIDTAINYRGMRSERDIGFVLEKMILREKTLNRENIVISTKAGIIPGDVEAKLRPVEYLQEVLLDQNVIKESDLNIVGHQRHVLAPSYYRFAIEQSKKHLKIDTIDIHYIHNPELSMIALGPQLFYKQLRDLLRFYEEQVEDGHIRYYGMAVWDAFLYNVGEPGYVSLEKVAQLATDVAGEEHHFRFIQVPFNIDRSDAYTKKNQRVKEEWCSTMEAATKLGIYVTTSAPFHLGKAIANESPHKLLSTILENESITSVMVGMKHVDNVKKNIETVVSMK